MILVNLEIIFFHYFLSHFLANFFTYACSKVGSAPLKRIWINDYPAIIIWNFQRTFNTFHLELNFQYFKRQMLSSAPLLENDLVCLRATGSNITTIDKLDPKLQNALSLDI